MWFAAPAIASVGWWRWTDLQGAGDLMPYLLVQILPLMLIPILQWRGDASRQQRPAFGLALALYVLAKLCEVADYAIFATLLVVSGHTLKHLLAVLAAAIIARHYIPSQTA